MRPTAKGMPLLEYFSTPKYFRVTIFSIRAIKIGSKLPGKNPASAIPLGSMKRPGKRAFDITIAITSMNPKAALAREVQSGSGHQVFI